MRLLIQRVASASVEVEGSKIGRIGQGLLIFLGVGKEDDYETADFYIEKMLNLRIFQDENGKTNLSLKDVEGDILLISQFTLYADCKKGNRPNFLQAGAPEQAEDIYSYFLSKCKGLVKKAEAGKFGADMNVCLVNEGPFTVLLDENLYKKL